MVRDSYNRRLNVTQLRLCQDTRTPRLYHTRTNMISTTRRVNMVVIQRRLRSLYRRVLKYTNTQMNNKVLSRTTSFVFQISHVPSLRNLYANGRRIITSRHFSDIILLTFNGRRTYLVM